MRVSVGDGKPAFPPGVTPPNGAASAPAAEKDPPRTLDNFLPISFTRAVLLGGLDAPTGGQSQSNPHPVLLRLEDNAMLPNRFRGQVRECFVIGAGYGDLSSERAYIRTEKLSCVRHDGLAMELNIKGSIFGEDGKVGVRGRLVSKQGQVLANALIAGVVSGLGAGLQASVTNTNNSPLGSVQTVDSNNALQAGLGQGLGKAMDRMAQYYISLAEKMFPIIEVDAGRLVDVVLTEGVVLDTPLTTKEVSLRQGRSGGPASRRADVLRTSGDNDD
jgi:conjugal transfer pilus assembly protein TraB